MRLLGFRPILPYDMYLNSVLSKSYFLECLKSPKRSVHRPSAGNRWSPLCHTHQFWPRILQAPVFEHSSKRNNVSSVQITSGDYPYVVCVNFDWIAFSKSQPNMTCGRAVGIRNRKYNKICAFLFYLFIFAFCFFFVYFFFIFFSSDTS